MELCQASGGGVVVDPYTGAVIAAGMGTVVLTNNSLHWWGHTVDTPGLPFTPSDSLSMLSLSLPPTYTSVRDRLMRMNPLTTRSSAGVDRQPGQGL